MSNDQIHINEAVTIVREFLADPGSILMPDDSLAPRILDAIEQLHDAHVAQQTEMIQPQQAIKKGNDHA